MGRSAHIRARRRRRARLSGRLQEELALRYKTKRENKAAGNALFREKRDHEKNARALELQMYPVKKRAPR